MILLTITTLQAQSQLTQCHKAQGKSITFLNDVIEIQEIAQDNYDEAIGGLGSCIYLYNAMEYVWEAKKKIKSESKGIERGIAIHCDSTIVKSHRNLVKKINGELDALEIDIETELNNPLNYCR